MAANNDAVVKVGNLVRFLSKCDQRFAARSNATQSAAGLMSTADKTALDQIAAWKAALVAADTTQY